MKRIPTVIELAQHVRQLSHAFKIELQEDPSLDLHGAKAGIEARFDDRKQIIEGSLRRRVIIHPVTHPTLYAVAMHELGHLLHPGGMLQDWHGAMNWLLKIDEETSAWEWAHYHALDWSPEMQQVEDMSLKGYRQQHEMAKVFAEMAKVFTLPIEHLEKRAKEIVERERHRMAEEKRLLKEARRRPKVPPRPLKDIFK